MLNYIRFVVFSLKNTNTLARPCVYIDNRPVIWVKAGNLRPSARGTPAATITMGGIRSELSLLHYRCTMLTDDFSTSGLAEDWFESECNVFNSFAAWTSESLDSIKWQVAVLLWTNGIHNNKWLVWGAGEYTKYSTDLETWRSVSMKILVCLLNS